MPPIPVKTPHLSKVVPHLRTPPRANPPKTSVPNVPAPKTGSGVNGSGQVKPGPVPNGASPAVVANFLTGPTFASDALASLGNLKGMFLRPGIDLKAEFTALTGKVNDTNSEANQNMIEMSSEQQKTKLDQKNQTICDAIDKLAEQQDCSILDKVKLAFEYIGAALSIALGAVASVFGGAGAPLIAAGVILMVIAVNDTIAATNPDGLGIGGLIAQAAGCTDQEILKYIDMAVTIVMAIVATVCSFGANAGSAAAVIALKVASTAVQVASAILNVTDGGLKLKNALIQSDAKGLNAKASECDADVKLAANAMHIAVKAQGDSMKRAAAALENVMQALTSGTDASLQAKFKA